MHGGIPREVVEREVTRDDVRKMQEERRRRAAITWAALPTADLLRIPGFDRVLEVFEDSSLPVEIDSDLNTPSESFDGLSPAAALRAGAPIDELVVWAHELHMSW